MVDGEIHLNSLIKGSSNKYLSNYVPIVLENVLLSVTYSRDYSEWHQEGRRWQENWHRKQERSPRELDPMLCLMCGSPVVLSFQLRGTSLCQHRKQRTLGAGDITETKILDTGNRLPELTAKQQMLYFCSRSLACSHSQTVPKCPWCEGPAPEMKSL